MSQKVNHNYEPPAYVGSAGKCKSYDIVKALYFDPRTMKHKEMCFERCLGTKECSPCNCHGDPLKCDFYPEKRGVGKEMNTAEMWLAAQKNGKWYVACDVLYNKKFGFVAKDDLKPWFNEKEGFGLYDVDKFMEYEWTEYHDVMSRKEAEEKFNIKIID